MYILSICRELHDEFIPEAQLEGTSTITTDTIITTAASSAEARLEETSTITTDATIIGTAAIAATTVTTATATLSTPTTLATSIRNKRQVELEDRLSSPCKRLKIIAQENIKVHNKNNIESMKVSDSIDLNKTNSRNDSHDSGNIIEEQDRMHYSKEGTSSNIEKIVNIKDKIEPTIKIGYEPLTENQQQHEESKDLILHENKKNQAVEGNSRITEEIQDEVPQNARRKQEELDIEESLNLFCDEIKSDF